MTELSFTMLREANRARCVQSYHPIAEWSPTDWATAMAGECGKACNKIERLRRLAATPESLSAQRAVQGQWSAADYEYAQLIGAAASELAGMIIYADLLAARLGIDLGEAIIEKFNLASERISSTVRLPEPNDN